MGENRENPIYENNGIMGQYFYVNLLENIALFYNREEISQKEVIQQDSDPKQRRGKGKCGLE